MRASRGTTPRSIRSIPTERVGSKSPKTLQETTLLRGGVARSGSSLCPKEECCSGKRGGWSHLFSSAPLREEEDRSVVDRKALGAGGTYRGVGGSGNANANNAGG